MVEFLLRRGAGMKKIVALIILVLGIGSLLDAGEATEKLQTLHREIGNNLLRIKKEVPQTQPIVYSVLDQLGKYHCVSKSVLEKKKRYKRLLNTEKSRSKVLESKLIDMESKFEKMKKVIIDANDKLKKDSFSASELKEQRDAIAKEREEFLKEKELFEHEKSQLVEARETILRDRNASCEKAPLVPIKQEKATEAKAKNHTTPVV